ncbi:MAG TPA: SusC/RagA family TonB-linked outer membrane protein [Candidatus Barnesiella excrementavium]|nr:SusC/RagA family TonB-linked outer membrane protein [Candidatus Barnesiella excrementavium]
MYKKSLKALIMAFALVSSLEASADAYSRISLSEVNTPVEDVLKKIEKEAKCLFVINTQVDTQRKVNLNVKNKTVSEILDIMFKGTDVSYSIQNPNIMLSKRTAAPSQAKSGTSSSATAQASNSRIVTGKVTDASGEALIGLTVKVAGTSAATATDIDGNYSIKVPAGGSELEFSYIGYETIKRPINGKDKIDVVMKDNTKLLDEVVVTAMGIARKEETLSYSTQTVGGDELTRAKEANLINSLQGKSAGLVITPNSGGAGGASKILLRGNASMLGNNSPLIVIDGVPMQNSVNGQMDMDGGGATMMADGSKETSDALSQLNPDDIESITVLKGANSAALYGSAASNGVLMITTKKGKEGQLRIDVSSSTTFETPLVLPKLQNVYGAQMSGSVDNGFSMNSNSWGQRMNTLGDEYYDTANSPYHLTRNAYNIRDFYQLGTNFNNSISLSGGTKVVQTYFSYGNTTANGIVETNKFERHNISLRQSFSFFKDKLKFDISANYINQRTKNRPTGGTFFNPIYQLYTSPRNLDMNWYRKNYYDTSATWTSNPYSYIVSQTGPNGLPISVIESGKTSTLSDSNYGKQVWFSDNISLNNPWWLLNRMTSEEVINRTFGSITANWQIIPELNLQARIKYDYNERNDENRQYATTWGNAEMIDRGRLILDHTKSQDFYGDFMLSYNKQIQDFTIGVNAGGSMMNSSYDQWMITPIAKSGAPNTEDLSCNQFVLSDIYISSSDNYGGLTTKNWERAIFATAQVTWQDKVTVEGSYRDDWYRAFTQFKDMDPHFAYYSAGASAQMNKLLTLPDQINELKLRASYSEVGNSIPNNLFLASASRNPATGAYISSAIVNFKNPKPETTQSFEAGFDISLLDRSISLQATYYNAIMKNQFMKYQGAAGKEIYINGGKVRNQGVELTASYIFAPNNDFSWITTFNYAFNDNKILTVARKQNGQKYIHEVDLGNLSGLKIKFEEGGSYGDLYAVGFMTDETSGQVVVDPQTGSPFKLNGQATEYLGNMNAKHTLGWANTFNYKDFSFYFLIDGKVGGKVISFTEAYLDYFGTSQRTGDARDYAINNGLYWTSDDGLDTKPGMYIPGTKQVVPVDQYYQTIGGGSPVGRNYVYDATNFRLREISLAYTFRNLFGPSKNLTVSANARNLFFLYLDAPIDPDTSLSTQNALSNVDIFSMPTTRSFGISLKASF